jgi:hypothetical protein
MQLHEGGMLRAAFVDVVATTIDSPIDAFDVDPDPVMPRRDGLRRTSARPSRSRTSSEALT